MARTEIRSAQIKDATVNRDDLDTATSGKAVVAKIIAGTNVTIGSTGADAGTGDVTVNIPVIDSTPTNGSTNLVSSDGVYDAIAAHAIVGINFIIDGGGSAITTGIKGDIMIPFACTITQVTLLADQSGSIVVDVWKDTYANYPPTNADSIAASAKPTLSSATKSQDSTLTGWTTSIAAGDTIRFNVDSITTCQRVTIILKVTKT